MKWLVNEQTFPLQVRYLWLHSHDDGGIQDNYVQDTIWKQDEEYDNDDEWNDEQTTLKEWCFQGQYKWGNLMRGLCDIKWLMKEQLKRKKELRRVSWENNSEGMDVIWFDEMSINDDWNESWGMVFGIRDFSEEPVLLIQCYCRTMKERVMWVSLNQEKWK